MALGHFFLFCLDKKEKSKLKKSNSVKWGRFTRCSIVACSIFHYPTTCKYWLLPLAIIPFMYAPYVSWKMGECQKFYNCNVNTWHFPAHPLVTKYMLNDVLYNSGIPVWLYKCPLLENRGTYQNVTPVYKVFLL